MNIEINFESRFGFYPCVCDLFDFFQKFSAADFPKSPMNFRVF